MSAREAPTAAPRSKAPPRRGFKWRKWNNILHRDLGYLCAGLTLVYAVSGLAVNHMRDWNPNYRITHDTVQLGTLGGATPGSPEFVDEVLAGVGASGPVLGTFRPDETTVQNCLEGGTVSVDLTTGEARTEQVRERPLLRAFNQLHLNVPKGLWTWMADLYALALAFLAITGIFVLRGKKGITGRGAWLTGAGVAIPVLFILLYL